MMKCFPGSGERGDLKPSRQQVANCAPWLEQELTLVRPDVLIPVGQLAIERFLARQGLRNWSAANSAVPSSDARSR